MANIFQRITRAVRLRLRFSAPNIYPQGNGAWQGMQLTGSRRGNNVRLSDTQLLAMNYGVVRQAVMRVAEDTAALRLHVEVRNARGRFDAAPDHPLAKLLETPIPWLTGHDARAITVQHLKLLGRAAWLVIDGAGGIPAELHLLQPDRLDTLPHPTLFIAGYRYRSLGGQQLEFAAFDPQIKSLSGQSVLELRVPDPINPYAGNSDVQAGANDIALSNEVKAYSRWFFANNATPGIVLESDQPHPGAEAAQAMREEWNEQFQGVVNSGKIARLWNGLTMRTISPPFKDLEYPALVRASRAEILMVMGVPGSVLGATEQGAMAGNAAEQERRSYEISTLEPMARRLEAALNRLAQRFGDGIRVRIESPVQTDVKLERDERRWQLEHGIISTSEYRALEGMEPSDQPAIYYRPNVLTAMLRLEAGGNGALPAPPAPDGTPARALFAAEYKRVKAAGRLNADLETELSAAWPASLRDTVTQMRRFALEKTQGDIVTAYEALKSEGAKLIAGIEANHARATQA